MKRFMYFILLVFFTVPLEGLKRMEQQHSKIGHRGACGYEPENTLCSFSKAMDLGVDFIELDVHRCKSGEIVVIHDKKVNRTTNGRGLVEDLTLEQLQKLDAGNGSIIPTLAQALDLIARKVRVIIELKAENTAECVASLIDLYVSKKGWDYHDFIVISFNHEELFRFSKFNSNVKIGVSYHNLPINKSSFYSKIKNAKYLVIYYKRVNSKLLKQLHEKDIKIFIYTVNNSQEINRMKRLGVDGIISDYPDKI